MEEYALAFKAILRSLIAKSGLTHAEISEGASTDDVLISSSSISDWANEKKARTPSVPQLVGLADYFNVTLDEIVGRSSQPRMPANCWLVDMDYVDAARQGKEPSDPEDRPAVPVPPRPKVMTSKEWEKLRAELQRLGGNNR